MGLANAVQTREIAARRSESLLDFETETLRAWFDVQPFTIQHRLAGHALFELPRLVELAARLPAEHVEYNAGNVPVSIAPGKSPRNGLSILETIRRIEECNSWLVLKNVEQEPDYRELMEACLNEIGDALDDRGTRMFKREAFIFISSPGSVTPFHMDPEHNFLLQLRGSKMVSVFQRDDREILNEQALEDYYSGGHRNLEFRDGFQRRASLFKLTPGMGLHFPVTAPHWVKNGEDVSISFSVTFRSGQSEKREAVYRLNRRMREAGFVPGPYGYSRGRDEVKYQTARVARRAGLLS